jgi:uncharacterized protein YbjT (DUF2867 family)
MDKNLEIQQGKAVADAAKAAGVERLIWSALANVTEGTNGKITVVEHFDSKAAVEQYIRDIGQPATFFMPAMFHSVILGNFRDFGDGKIYFTTPFNLDTKVPLYDPAADTGTFVAAILLKQDETLNKRVPGSAPYITTQKIIDDFKEATGIEATYKHLSWDEFKGALQGAGMPEFAATELEGNFQLVVDYDYYVGEPADAVDKSQELVKSAGLKAPVDWKAYAAKHYKKQ